MGKTLAVGARAPELTLIGPDDRPVRLADLLGRRTVVLYFYPKDDTQGCTRQACAFRDAYQAFQDAGADVIGVSADPAASHRGFAARHRLPFLLLSDPAGDGRRAFGVKGALGVLPGRVTFVIDRAGVIRDVFESLLQAEAHVERALGLVRSLEGEAAAARP
jgi:peroxiredoxin Q/BCP